MSNLMASMATAGNALGDVTRKGAPAAGEPLADIRQRRTVTSLSSTVTAATVAPSGEAARCRT